MNLSLVTYPSGSAEAVPREILLRLPSDFAQQGRYRTFAEFCGSTGCRSCSVGRLKLEEPSKILSGNGIFDTDDLPQHY